MSVIAKGAAESDEIPPAERLREADKVRRAKNALSRVTARRAEKAHATIEADGWTGVPAGETRPARAARPRAGGPAPSAGEDAGPSPAGHDDFDADPAAGVLDGPLDAGVLDAGALDAGALSAGSSGRGSQRLQRGIAALAKERRTALEGGGAKPARPAPHRAARPASPRTARPAPPRAVMAKRPEAAKVPAPDNANSPSPPAPPAEEDAGPSPAGHEGFEGDPAAGVIDGSPDAGSIDVGTRAERLDAGHIAARALAERLGVGHLDDGALAEYLGVDPLDLGALAEFLADEDLDAEDLAEDLDDEDLDDEDLDDEDLDAEDLAEDLDDEDLDAEDLDDEDLDAEDLAEDLDDEDLDAGALGAGALGGGSPKAPVHAFPTAAPRGSATPGDIAGEAAHLAGGAGGSLLNERGAFESLSGARMAGQNPSNPYGSALSERLLAEFGGDRKDSTPNGVTKPERPREEFGSDFICEPVIGASGEAPPAARRDSLSGKAAAEAGSEPGSEVPSETPAGSGRPIWGGEYQGLELVTGSRVWYLGQNERLTKTTLVLGLATLVGLALAACLILFQPEPRYFAVTGDLRVLEMPPLSEPVVSDQAILNWSAEVLAKSLSLNFLTWRRTLAEIRGDFDSRGYNSYVKALDEAGHIKKIEAERLSLSCVVGGAPVVVESGLERDVMTWRLETPLTLSIESSAGVVATQRLMAEVVVRRAPTTRNPRGVVIHQVILGPSV